MIEPKLFLSMLKSGSRRVISKEYELNQLNVFPVTDRDTGSNMAALMNFIIAQPYSTANFKVLLEEIAEAALLGSCGNSGMIFSAFFTGVASVKLDSGVNYITIKQFIDCMKKGVSNAYHSVSEPIEGTILSVMSAWVKACDNVLAETDNLKLLFKKTLPIANEALKKTELQLAVLKQNKVVDAGALGFFEFLSGMNDYLLREQSFTHQDADPIAHHNLMSHHSHFESEQPNYHYCAETLLSSAKPHEHLKSDLEKLGDCVVINESARYLKIHIHTSNVLGMTELLKSHGNIQYQKIDPMKSQWEVAHARKYSIALVTDSSADLPADFITNEQIHVLPLHLRLGQHTLLDKVSINLDKMYHEIHENNEPANTAGPSTESVSRYLSFLSQHYDSVIVMTLSSHLSCTYQTISNLATSLKHKKIEVIDTRTTSAAQGILLMLATKWIAQGHSHDVVSKKIRDAINDTKIFVAVNEFKTITKLGRAPKAVGLLAAWSHFKPIISVNSLGKPCITKFAVGQAMCWKKMAKLISKLKSTGINTIGIVYSSSLEKAQEFADYISKMAQVKINFITQTSAVIGLHAGIDCIAIAISKESLA